MVRPVLFKRTFIQADGQIANADNGDWRDDEGKDEAGHFSPPRVRLASKCKSTQAEIQPIPPPIIVQTGRFSRRLLIL